jgi:hypothetical protein
LSNFFLFQERESDIGFSKTCFIVRDTNRRYLKFSEWNIIGLWSSIKVGNILASWVAINVSRRAVSYILHNIKHQISSVLFFVTMQQLNIFYYLLLCHHHHHHHHHHHLGLGHGRSVSFSWTVCWSLYFNCGPSVFRILLGCIVTFFQFVCLPFVECGIRLLLCIACYTRQTFYFCCFNLCFLRYFIVQILTRYVSMGTAMTSHCGRPGSNPDLVMWNLWWTKWRWGRFFSDYFGFPCQSSFHQFLPNHSHLSSGAGTIGH